MKKDKLIELLKNENHFSVPKYLLMYARKYKLDVDSLILLIYLVNCKNKDVFDYEKIMKDVDFSKEEMFNAISTLKDKKLVTIETVKNESGILEERLSVDSFYDIAFSQILEDNKEVSDDSIFGIFEEEFGRTLSPIEYEIINSWLDSKIDEDLIKEALKEAVFNGVNNLRYIDKILYEWNKKGIKNPKDVENKVKTEEEKEEDFYEYDWLNE